MTITKPTLIVTDRDEEDFAITFEELVDLTPWRKGTCLVVPQARRKMPGKQEKKGFVSVPAGKSQEVEMIPGGWDILKRWEERVEEECAGGCGRQGVKACTGCKAVKYCGKV